MYPFKYMKYIISYNFFLKLLFIFAWWKSRFNDQRKKIKLLSNAFCKKIPTACLTTHIGLSTPWLLVEQFSRRI